MSSPGFYNSYNMKRPFLLSAFLSACLTLSAQPALRGPVDTLDFKQADFEWHVTPRYDYSQTLMGKLFLSQAHYDQRFKLRDNGKQTNYMDCAQALEAIKAMDAITLGLPKIIYLVGWQYNGHDSKYPAFFECNEAVKAPGDSDARESILKLMEEAKKYNTAVSFHINMFNCYDDSPLFEKYVQDDVLAKHESGEYVHSDWGWAVSYARDWATGNAQARLDKLCELFPIAEAGTLHIDAFHSSTPMPLVEGDEIVIRYVSPISPYHGLTKQDELNAQLNIIKYLDSKGIDVTSEFCPGEAFFGYLPAVWHKHEMKYYLSRTERQMGHTNSWNIVFGRNVNPESVFKDGGETMAQKAETFKREFCKKSLPFLYISHLTPICYYYGTENDDKAAQFTEDVKTVYVDDHFYLYKGDVKLADGNDFFVPAKWVGENVVVAYSEDGYDKKEWTLPSDIKAKGSATAYVVDADGQHFSRKLRVRGRKLTLTLAPGEMVKIVF